MTALEAQQRGLLDLLKRRGPLPEDPYLRLVSESPALAVVRATALFWRGYQLRSQCQFTASLLRRLACFDACVTDYFCHNGTSPYTDQLSRGFLHYLLSDPRPLVRSVAEFELAVLELKSGSAHRFEIAWDRNPNLVLEALSTGSHLPAEDGHGDLFVTTIDRALPDLVTWSRVQVHDRAVT